MIVDLIPHLFDTEWRGFGCEVAPNPAGVFSVWGRICFQELAHLAIDLATVLVAVKIVPVAMTERRGESIAPLVGHQ